MDSALFVFLVLNVMIFSVNCASSTALSTKVCDDSDVRDAIQKLETKVENLIALVKKISAPKPPPPGIRVEQKKNTRVSVQTVQFVLGTANLNFTDLSTAVFASSCNEQYEKYK